MKRLQIPQNYVYEKFYVHEIAAVNLSKVYFLKNAKKTCKPNNRDLNRDWIRNKKLHDRSLYFTNYNTNLSSHEFTETSETEYSSNKYGPQSSLKNRNHTKLIELNSGLALLESLISEQFIYYTRKSLQEVNSLYQQNGNNSTYTSALIKQIDDLEEMLRPIFCILYSDRKWKIM